LAETSKTVAVSDTHKHVTGKHWLHHNQVMCLQRSHNGMLLNGQEQHMPVYNTMFASAHNEPQLQLSLLPDWSILKEADTLQLA
jgi:hypothetical protein